MSHLHSLHHDRSSLIDQNLNDQILIDDFLPIIMSANASTFSSIRALWSTLFGVGMYFTPRAFAKSEILLGCLQLFGVGLISFLSIFALFFFSKKKTEENLRNNINEDASIPLNTHSINLQFDEEEKENELNSEITQNDVSYAGLGKGINKWIGRAIDSFILIANISTVLFFQKYISLISFSLLPQSLIENFPFDPYFVFIFIYGAIIWACGLFKNLQSIDWLSLISFGCILTNCIIVGIMTCLLGDYRSTHVSNPGYSISLSAISTFIFSMDCQTNVVEVFSEMENKNIVNLAIVAFSAAFGACMFYGSIGIAGSLLFGDNMPNEDIITILANSESSLVKYLSSRNSKFYCVHYIVPCLAILGLLISSVYQLSAVTRSLNEKKIFKKNLTLNIRQVVTTGIVIIGVSIFNMFPQISLELVFAFIGQFMSNFLGYFFPFIFIAYLYWKKKKIYSFINVIIPICSIVFGLYGFTDFIMLYFFSHEYLNIDKDLADGVSEGLT